MKLRSCFFALLVILAGETISAKDVSVDKLIDEPNKYLNTEVTIKGSALAEGSKSRGFYLLSEESEIWVKLEGKEEIEYEYEDYEIEGILRIDDEEELYVEANSIDCVSCEEESEISIALYVLSGIIIVLLIILIRTMGKNKKQPVDPFQQFNQEPTSPAPTAPIAPAPSSSFDSSQGQGSAARKDDGYSTISFNTRDLPQMPTADRPVSPPPVPPSEPKPTPPPTPTPSSSPASPAKTMAMTRPPVNELKVLPGKFIVLAGYNEAKEFVISGRPSSIGNIATIGREEPSITNKPSHMHLKHDTVSRRQAELTEANGRLTIKNLSGTNPTMVNDRILTVGEEVELRRGSKIKMGNIVLEYHI